MSVGHSGLDDQRLQPAKVLDSDEVQGPAHGPSQDDRPLVQASPIHLLRSQPYGANPKGECGRRQDLSLHASQMSHQVNDGATLRSVEMLRGGAQAAHAIVA